MPLARINGRILHFVHIPKTGGSSVKAFLQRHGTLALYCWPPVAWGRTSPQHMEAEAHAHLVPDGFCDASFAIFRDPVSRLESEYRYRAKALRQAMPDATPVNAVEWIDGTPFCGGFDAWVRATLTAYEADPFVYDNHIRPQSHFWRRGLTPFLFENGLQPVFGWVGEFCSVDTADFETPHLNPGPRIDLNMSRETRALIERFYSADFALIGGLRDKQSPASGLASRLRRAGFREVSAFRHYLLPP